jgi:hypothetical protein
MMRSPRDLPPHAIRDTVYADSERYVVPCSCPCCNECWLVVHGKGVGRCVNGGPYLGYVAQRE